MLELDDLQYAHPGTERRWRFTLRAEPASVSVISGSSGCGKSTLLELVAGLLNPCAGELRWRGQSWLTLAAGARPMSLLFQQHNLFEHLSALDNVLLGHRGKLDAPARRAAGEALAAMGLGEHAGTRADRLSGGQMQRVALARTLLRRSQVVLLDEPFSALDDDTRTSVRPLVRELADRHGCCVLMVSHDRRDGAAIADRQWRVQGGVLAPLDADT